MKRRPLRRRAPDGLSAQIGPRALLREERQTGFPREYVLSRIRGRRAKLIRNWRALLQEASPADHLASSQYQGFVRERTIEGMWRALLQENGWVFGQLDETLRRELAPYFFYVELRTLFMCLRYLHAERPQETGDLLAASLLSRTFVAPLLAGDAAVAVEGLEERLEALSPRFRGMAENYATDGLRAVERSVTDAYLLHVLTLPLSSVLRGFFVRLIDARNILALLRSQRSGAREQGVFLPGGTFTPEALASLLARNDPFAVLTLLRRATGIAQNEPEPTRVETALYRGVTRFLRLESRDPLGTGTVLDYLWRCSLEVTNLSLLFAGKDLEREELAAELVT